MKRICCFAGHSDTYSEKISAQVKAMAEKLITDENVTEFWVGNYGGFDRICANAIVNLKEVYPFIKLSLVIPYLTVDINDPNKFFLKNFDSIIIAEIPEKTPYKFKISKCNQYMVKKSDFLICYITRSWGGALKTYEYARRQKHIVIFNLANNQGSPSVIP